MCVSALDHLGGYGCYVESFGTLRHRGCELPIPESQLSRWSDHGSQDAAKHTRAVIGRALDAYRWPAGVKYDFYLQGSYQNDTNISGDSDIDVLLELKSTFYHDMDEPSDLERRRLTLSEIDFDEATDYDSHMAEECEGLCGI